MPSVEDISWQVLRRIVRRWQGDSAELDEVKSLVGGSVNQTFSLQTSDGSRAVLKISPHRVNRDLERESRQLELLRTLAFPVPQVYLCDIGSLDHPFSYLLMEFCDGISLAEARMRCSGEAFDRLQERLAEMVAALHDQKSGHYGRVASTNGQSTTYTSWPAFYRAVYDSIWHEAERSPLLPSKCRKPIHKVHERLDRLLAHSDCPRLVHWDIWDTNVLVAPDEKGEWRITALLDPNCRFAHAEAEIAYMELFHTITPAFMKAYRARHKLPPEYHAVRKPIYQLYPLLHHLTLFGHDYVKPLQSAVHRLRAIV